MTRRVLVSRTDRIGDVVLTLPLCGLLATRLGAEVCFLGRSYTRPVLEASPYVHRVLDWDEVADRPAGEQAELIASSGADTVLHVFPRLEVARAAWAARIPQRVGARQRLFHWLYCNRLPSLPRRSSDLHEAQLNVRLAEGLLGRGPWPLEALRPLTRLRPTAGVPAWAAERIDPDRYILVLHPKSAGSTREWPLERWAEVAWGLDPERFRVLVTGSAAERALLGDWLAGLPPGTVDLTGRLSLPELIAVLGAVDGMVAVGTGPLHLAAGVGIDTLGLFPPVRPIHPGRWAPLGPRAEWLAGERPCSACVRGKKGCSCMLAIPADAVRERVERWAAHRPPRGAPTA